MKKKMKKINSQMATLVLSSMLLWGAAPLAAQELVLKESADMGAYCHMKFPPMRPDTLSWEQPVLDENVGSVIDFYGPCDHDPTGAEEVNIQRRIFRAEHYGDGD
jgi:hypothetical protein